MTDQGETSKDRALAAIAKVRESIEAGAEVSDGRWKDCACGHLHRAVTGNELDWTPEMATALPEIETINEALGLEARGRQDPYDVLSGAFIDRTFGGDEEHADVLLAMLDDAEAVLRA